MKYPCDVIRDLLPLYHDDICSDSSKKIVEEHLLECDSCKDILKKIDNATYDTRLQEERRNVVGHYITKVKRKSLVAGLWFASVLAVPVLVCLIVNLVAGQGLDWFFIVLAALMVLGSVTTVPLIAEKRKFLWTIGSFTGSLLLLLLVCCLYRQGDWFFVAAIPVLFGLSVIFLPFVLHQLLLKGFASRHKGLIAMAVDTILLYAVVIVSGLYGRFADYWPGALLNTTINVLFPWIVFVIIRYVKSNGLIKSGLCTLVSGVFISTIHDMINLVNEGLCRISLTNANLFSWNGETINPNIYLLTLLAGCVVGAILLIFGLIRGRHPKSTD